MDWYKIWGLDKANHFKKLYSTIEHLFDIDVWKKLERHTEVAKNLILEIPDDVSYQDFINEKLNEEDIYHINRNVREHSKSDFYESVNNMRKDKVFEHFEPLVNEIEKYFQ